MDPRERNQFVDELLDSALARYRSAEPRPGLEERLLARLRVESQPRPWFGWAWKLATGLAALGMVVTMAHLARRTSHVRGPLAPTLTAEAPKTPASAITPQPGVAPRVVPSQSARRRVPRNMAPLASRLRESEPRKEMFPSPAPLSEQERLLLTDVNLYPPRDMLRFHTSDQEIEEIQIKPLEIKPLETQLAPSENVTN